MSPRITVQQDILYCVRKACLRWETTYLLSRGKAFACISALQHLASEVVHSQLPSILCFLCYNRKAEVEQEP